MKREEAIDLLGWMKNKTNREDDLEAIDMAIEALQEEAAKIPIKLEKRYPESKDEDIADAFMRGYIAGRFPGETVKGGDGDE